MADTATLPTVGALLRGWRERRHLSQLRLALDTGVSARHLSFLETGRAQPSQEMLLRLAEQLDVPLRERNRLLLAAGFAPVFGEHELGEPQLEPIRDVLDVILRGHEPYPAVVVDRHWQLVAANGALAVLVEGVAPWLLEPPVNVLRASLHPEGAAPRIANLGQWRAHVLERLGRHVVATGDPVLRELHDELRALPGDDGPPGHATPEIAVPLRIATSAGELRLISTVATFGTATDVTVSELAIETFFPADAETAAALRSRASGG